MLPLKVQHLLVNYGERNIGWGNLHIVLEDGNLEDSHVDYCLKAALEDLDGEGAILAYHIRQLSFQDRERLYNKL